MQTRKWYVRKEKLAHNDIYSTWLYMNDCYDETTDFGQAQKFNEMEDAITACADMNRQTMHNSWEVMEMK